MNVQLLTKELKNNWKSGVTLSLVSVPLSLSLSIAAGATPIMGIVTAVWAGLFAGLFGGSKFNIVGPTGALAGILTLYTFQYGAAVLPFLAVSSGMVTLLFWLLHWERYIVLIPSSVVHGFTLGIALIIGLSQLNFLLGLENIKVHDHLITNVFESLGHIYQANIFAVVIFIVGLVVIFTISKYFPKAPGSIFIALFGIAIGYASVSGITPFYLPTLYSVYGDLHLNLIQPNFFSFDYLSLPLLKATFIIVLVGIIETLISGKIADGMTRTHFNQSKEVFGLGLANIASGLFGGIPATAALARTALNVKSGATSKTSAVISAIGVAVISLFLISIFKFLPLAIVASILVFVAVRMVQAEHFINLYRHDKKVFLLSLLVAAITIVEDPIIAILVGAVIALLMFLKQFSKAQSEVTLNYQGKMVSRLPASQFNEQEVISDCLVYRFAGELTYINSQMHLANITQIRKIPNVVLSFRNLFYIDLDGMDAIKEMITELRSHEIQVYISSIPDILLPFLSQQDWFKELQMQGKIFSSASEAVTRVATT